jgi:hypothetical protein
MRLAHKPNRKLLRAKLEATAKKEG